jgi:hypothetical protein
MALTTQTHCVYDGEKVNLCSIEDAHNTCRQHSRDAREYHPFPLDATHSFTHLYMTIRKVRCIANCPSRLAKK